ncbi:MAG: LysR family transcriptional regulator [Burkholderiaceae bacterium]|nr:LysR family transcriptional regulator [Burkholderiaceae bacterium]MCD8518168.1 LysR family transcriptional regulator [Burkholderiaceae bacterium]MCD8537753.1 LysR family transcriptional regulator [Burkholderiaceae bacterium]MCD8564172.1 LysR family transcriptional regulator [Burkholderiaceae bacterium]
MTSTATNAAHQSTDANDLILFAELIEAGGFTALSRQVDWPKSTISRRIAALETRLGQRLLTRTTRKLVVTDFGERMLEHARRLQDEWQAAIALAQHEQVKPQGLLRVSLPPDLAQLELASVLIQFAARHPAVRVELDLSARRVDLLAERFDLAVRIAGQLPDDTTLVARKLCDMNVHLYASAAYLRQFGRPRHPAELLSHTCLRLISSSGESLAWRLQSKEGAWEGLPSGPMSSNSPSLQRQLAVNGLGIVALADVLVTQEVAQGRLERVLPDWSLPTLAVWCVTPGRRLLPARTRAFMELLQATMRG